MTYVSGRLIGFVLALAAIAAPAAAQRHRNILHGQGHRRRRNDSSRPGPQKAQKHSSRPFDIKRVEHLAQLNMSVNTYYGFNGRLPAALSELQQETGHAPSLRDLATAERYEYRVIDASAYELCATFQQPSKGAAAVGGNAVRVEHLRLLRPWCL